MMDDSAASSSRPAPVAPPRRLHVSRLHYSPVGLLIAMVLIVLVTPFGTDLPNGDLIEAVLLSLVVGSAVLAVGARRCSWIIAVILAVPAVGGKWMNHFRPDLVRPEFFLIPAMAFVIFIMGHLLQFILRAPRVDVSVICAGISIYLMLGFLWAIAYGLVSRNWPDSFLFTAGAPPNGVFDGFTAFYFSMATLSTVGYGDIAPLSRPARMLAITESTTGVFYVTILITRLVSLYSRMPAKRPTSERDSRAP